jgi:dTDP-glucose pyrophosphorylase
MNLVIPMASPRESSRATGGLPLYLHSFHGTTLLEYTIALARRLTSDGDRVVFVMDGADAEEFRMRQMVEISLPGASIVTTMAPTQGALCTVLLAVDHLAVEEPLLIVGANALHRGLPSTLANALADGRAVAMTWVFRSVNPRFSFVRTTDDGRVLEASEKDPISNVATTGIFLFRTAREFLDAAFAVIKKEWHTKGNYFVAPVLNELIVRGEVVRATSTTSRPPIFFHGDEHSPAMRQEAQP